MQSTKLFSITLCSFIPLILPAPVFAGDVVINEFLLDPDSDQWVELYNKGSSALDIGGWFIDDDGGTQKYTIPQPTVIGPSEFRVFESGLFNLNRTSADSVRLLNGETLEDSYTYQRGPGVGRSFGRATDGMGEWVVFDLPTRGGPNVSSAAAPSPTTTLTLTSTTTPSPADLPTPTPRPTVTPRPQSTPRPTPTLKPTPAQRSRQSSSSGRSTSPQEGGGPGATLLEEPSEKPKPVSTALKVRKKAKLPTKAKLPKIRLSIKNAKVKISPKPTPTQNVLEDSMGVKPQDFVVGGGFMLLASGIMLAWRKRGLPKEST